MQKSAAARVCQSDAEREEGMGRRQENLPQGGYGRAGDNMAKAAETLEANGRLPRVVWRTSADTALH